MGVMYLQHPGGTHVFSCNCCVTALTHRHELISTRFTGATGRAYLFKKVVNLTFSEVQDRMMLTGRHLVRDVMCKKCGTKLGWLYEWAAEEAQRYKEGRVILERALISEHESSHGDTPRCVLSKGVAVGSSSFRLPFRTSGSQGSESSSSSSSGSSGAGASLSVGMSAIHSLLGSITPGYVFPRSGDTSP